MGEQSFTNNNRIWLWAILLLAVALRVWTFRAFSIHHEDEIYQYLEQAHRLITGQGLVPWEYRVGMRSWLPPLLLSLPMRIGEAIAPGSLLPVVLARSFVAAIALMPIFAAYSIGSRLSKLHGLVAATVFAIWFEDIYFSGQLLTEVAAFACFLPAAALIRRDASRRALVAGGALLALAGLLRFQYAPAIAIFGILALGNRWRDWRPVVAGGLVMATLSAAVDVVMGQAPFGWVLVNIHENLVKGAADRFGVDGHFAYFQMLLLRWGVAAPLLIILPVMMLRRFPALFWAAMVNLLVHMAIGHKEYRFIWLTTQLFLLLSALASVELLQNGLKRWKAGEKGSSGAIILLIVGWAGLSFMLAERDPLWPNWNRFGARLAAVASAGRVEGLCGVAIHDIHYWSGSYAYLRRDVPLYHPYSRDRSEGYRALAANAHAYNVIIALEGSARNVPAGYRPIHCEDDLNERVCVYLRPGGCTPEGSAPVLLQNVITRYRL